MAYQAFDTTIFNFHINNGSDSEITSALPVICYKCWPLNVPQSMIRNSKSRAQHLCFKTPPVWCWWCTPGKPRQADTWVPGQLRLHCTFQVNQRYTVRLFIREKRENKQNKPNPKFSRGFMYTKGWEILKNKNP